MGSGSRTGAIVVLTAVAGVGSAAEPRLDVLLPAYVPSAGTFIARVRAIHTWAKKTVGDPEDRRVLTRARNIMARRSSAPAWTSHTKPWADTSEYTVHFAVGRVEDYQSSSVALNEAEHRAGAALAELAGGGRPYPLDWYVNDDGVAWALVGAIEPPKGREPKTERPGEPETPVTGAEPRQEAAPAPP